MVRIIWSWVNIIGVVVAFSVGQHGDIQLSGDFILDNHCSFMNENGEVTIVSLIKVALNKAMPAVISLLPCSHMRVDDGAYDLMAAFNVSLLQCDV